MSAACTCDISKDPEVERKAKQFIRRCIAQLRLKWPTSTILFCPEAAPVDRAEQLWNWVSALNIDKLFVVREGKHDHSRVGCLMEEDTKRNMFYQLREQMIDQTYWIHKECIWDCSKDMIYDSVDLKTPKAIVKKRIRDQLLRIPGNPHVFNDKKFYPDHQNDQAVVEAIHCHWTSIFLCRTDDAYSRYGIHTDHRSLNVYQNERQLPAPITNVMDADY